LFINSSAVVLRTIPFSDTSLICRLFTKEKGKISIMAKGARRKKNLLSSVLESGNIIRLQYIYKESRDIQLLKEASIEFSVYSLRDNLEKLLTLYSMIEILDKTTHPLNEAPILFRLIYRTLQELTKKENNSKILYNFYLLHLIIQNGFRPNLEYCSNCNDTFSNSYIILLNGELICNQCNNETSFKKINIESLLVLKKLIYTNIEKLNKININKINSNAISLFLEEFISFHMEGMISVKSTSIMHKIIN
tara:strand:+ start:3482 stop:4231 length:750 start_codon:yes stop_codon:yes gene_type:complete